MLVEAGATIGGTAAAGLSGPGRFRYGGIRDFLLGARFVSGDGQTICAGGKVVKNAAGFDLQKFLVGSMGRMGVLLELTFKVFPKPSALRTLRVQCDSHTQALARMAKAACSRWELDAIDYRPGERSMVLRLAGPARAIESIDHEIGTTWGEDVAELPLADTFWQSVNELNWSAPGAAAVKVPTTPPQCIALHQGLAGEEAIAMHGSVAGNVAWLLVASTDGLAAVDRQLQVMNIPGLVVRGTYDTPYLGVWQSPKIQQAVQAAMDPPAKFLSLDRHPRPPAQVN